MHARFNVLITSIGWFPYVVSLDKAIPSIPYLTIFEISPISVKLGASNVSIDSKI